MISKRCCKAQNHCIFFITVHKGTASSPYRQCSVMTAEGSTGNMKFPLQSLSGRGHFRGYQQDCFLVKVLSVM